MCPNHQSPCARSLCSATRGATTMRSPHTELKSNPHSLQLAKASSKEDPAQPREINLKKKKKKVRLRDLKAKLLYRGRNLGSFHRLGWKKDDYHFLCLCVCVCVCSVVTVAHRAPLSMGFFRQEYLSRLPFPSPGDLPNPGIEPTSPGSPVLAGRFFTTEPPGRPTTEPPGRPTTLQKLLLWRWPVSPTASYPMQAILISHLAVAFDVTEHFIF